LCQQNHTARLSLVDYLNIKNTLLANERVDQLEAACARRRAPKAERT